ncbi:dihydroneopterin aldolase [Legionella worsleiensis]|uniref:7,8-dihydroneopterin aldolase n=1 Tax=Legionella worsleiensis TaxID=45076 RepID=A0A0W1AIY9_9GAMM|nr:dihydroneopterin aldolase [Legionella worsleiensis]KTD81291.1 dihydroneopterin aldolase FolB [Legionella worsleiensis]STY30819.1 dihydroneopterin aldolase [Legionella worsleiensis]
MDYLKISALKVAAQIGVHAWEQRIKQQLLIDITIPSDFTHCQDSLNNTLDYDALCQLVTQYVESNSFQLIEAVANQVSALIKKEFNLDEITVAVSKPHAIKNAGNVQVLVSR